MSHEAHLSLSHVISHTSPSLARMSCEPALAFALCARCGAEQQSMQSRRCRGPCSTAKKPTSVVHKYSLVRSHSLCGGRNRQLQHGHDDAAVRGAPVRGARARERRSRARARPASSRGRSGHGLGRLPGLPAGLGALRQPGGRPVLLPGARPARPGAPDAGARAARPALRHLSKVQSLRSRADQCQCLHD